MRCCFESGTRRCKTGLQIGPTVGQTGTSGFTDHPRSDPTHGRPGTQTLILSSDHHPPHRSLKVRL